MTFIVKQSSLGSTGPDGNRLPEPGSWSGLKDCWGHGGPYEVALCDPLYDRAGIGGLKRFWNAL